MGIWNALENRIADQHDAALITPHGDLELDRQRAMAFPTVYSLPLMGIWNFQNPSKLGKFVKPHYPSWGFGTGDGYSAKEAIQQLITPHGDLEPASRARPGRRIAASLPLMGIWNSIRNAPGRRRAQLITPHGDLELEVYAPDLTLEDNSLPLMGIWNARASAASPDSALLLITPHGDLEPEGGIAVEGSPSSAHYPSWGFGTRGPALHRRTVRYCSLPLMGIWNKLAPGGVGGVAHSSLPLMGIWNRLATPSYPQALKNSLPLMGIWNGDGEVDLRRGRQHLITPHGDLEPRRRGACCPASRSHYPSWGFGTR